MRKMRKTSSEAGISTAKSVQEALRGLGYPSVNLDGRRIKLPVRLAESGIFRDGIAVTYAPPSMLHLVPNPLWDDYLAIRRRVLCEDGGMGDNVFKILVAGAMATLQLEANDRIQLPVDHINFLQLADAERTLVLVPGEIWVTVMTWKYFQAMFEAARAAADKIADRIGHPILSHDEHSSAQTCPTVTTDMQKKISDNVGIKSEKCRRNKAQKQKGGEHVESQENIRRRKIGSGD